MILNEQCALCFEFSEIYSLQSIKLNMGVCHCPLEARHNWWQSVKSENFCFFCDSTFHMECPVGMDEMISLDVHFFCFILLPLPSMRVSGALITHSKPFRTTWTSLQYCVMCYLLSHWKWTFWRRGYLLMVSSLFVELNSNFYNSQ